MAYTEEDTIPTEHAGAFKTMKESPTLSYIVTCAFLFYVFMCATLLDTLVGYNLRRYIKNNEKMKHALGLVVLIFTIGVVTNIHNIGIIVIAGAMVYAWFLAMTKMPAQWNVLIMFLLMVCFIINSLISHRYTPEWVFSVHTQEEQNKREKTRENCIYAVYIIGIVTLVVSLVCIGWFYYPRRREHIIEYILSTPALHSKRDATAPTLTSEDYTTWHAWVAAPGGLDAWRKTEEGNKLAWSRFKEWVFQPYSEFTDFTQLWKGMDIKHHISEDVNDIMHVLQTDENFLKALKKATLRLNAK